MLKGVITEAEFDSLADQSQMQYRYCPICYNYHLYPLFKGCPINHERRELIEDIKNNNRACGRSPGADND
jgi:hypothetical protein